MAHRVLLLLVVTLLGGLVSSQEFNGHLIWESEVERIAPLKPPTAHDSPIRDNDGAIPIYHKEPNERKIEELEMTMDAERNSLMFDKSKTKNDIIASDITPLTSQVGQKADRSDSLEAVKPLKNNDLLNSYDSYASSRTDRSQLLDERNSNFFDHFVNWVFGDLQLSKKGSEGEENRRTSIEQDNETTLLEQIEPTVSRSSDKFEPEHLSNTARKSRVNLNVTGYQANNSQFSITDQFNISMTPAQEQSRSWVVRRSEKRSSKSYDMTWISFYPPHPEIEEKKLSMEKFPSTGTNQSPLNETQSIGKWSNATKETDGELTDPTETTGDKSIQDIDRFDSEGQAIQDALMNPSYSMTEYNFKASNSLKNETSLENNLHWVNEGLLSDQPPSVVEPAGASLAFVFDSTGSMQDELNQVKVGAAQILTALLTSDEIVIHNFVLVPFNDPGIGPVSVTTNPKEFQMLIEDISVHGGGDCPEMSVGAIKKALEVSRPNSYFYVFTDASAKDFHLQDDVLALIQQLQAQVVFILTGTCDHHDTEYYGVYNHLADASSGQVYHLSKSEVKQVLKYVKVSLRSNKVNLLSLNRPAPTGNSSDNHTVVIDETLKEFTVSVSGKNAGISVRDPQGVSRSGTPDVEPLLTLTNVKILSVKEPDPGPWQLSVDSESDYSLRATGRSAVHFRHGFSTIPTANMAETNHRPLQGANCHLLIQASDAVTVHNLTYADIVGMNGTVLRRLPLAPVPSAPGTFFAENFTPPTQFFHLGISGYGRDGFPIKRVTSTAISSSLPEKPRITMRPRTISRVNSPLTLSCHVNSLVPFSVLWFRDGRPITSPITHQQTFIAELRIEKVTESSDGNYTCQAKSVAGMEWKTTQLSVTGPPPTVSVASRVVAAMGDAVELSCSVTSDFRPVVKWAQLSTRNKFTGILHPVLGGLVHANNSLTFHNVGEADEGWYVCSAESRGGRGEARVFLEVRDPLRVTVSPSNVSFTRGGSVKLTCSASGRPSPTLQWRRDLVAITNTDPSAYLEEVNGQLHLLLNLLDQRRSGVYSCVATNSEESVTAHAELYYTEKPTVSAAANSVMVRMGAEAVFTCSAKGVPKPVITWRREGKILHSDSHFQVENNTLQIPVVAAADAGEFTCMARNVVGEDMDHIGLFVGSPPIFLQRPRDKKIQLGHNGTVFCSVSGSPPPDIVWSRVEAALDTKRMAPLPGGALRIILAQVSDAGRYRCSAQNPFGNVSAEANVNITGIVKPGVDKSLDLSEVRVVAGGAVSLPCGVELGNPPGTVNWLRNGEPIPETDGSVAANGRLDLSEVVVTAGGSYICWVSNPLGNASRVFQLEILEGPHIVEGIPNFEGPVTVKIGNRVVLPCPAVGNPRPKIRWFKEGAPVHITAHTYQDINGSLVMDTIEEGNGGMYTCTGVNELGSTSIEIHLEVHVPPKPVDQVVNNELPQEVVEGHVVVFNCQMYAVPSPKVAWFKDNLPLYSEAEEVTSQVLRFVATVDDRGLYKCVVTNEAGSASREFHLNILVPPRIADPGDEPVQARAGGSATLQCGVTGLPAPDVLWRRHGSYLTYNTSDLTLLGPLLVLHNVTEDAAGAYTCDAENLAGIAQQTFYLHVTSLPRIMEYEGGTGVLSITVREGEEYSLPCVAEGNPKPDISWSKDGEPIHPYLTGIVMLGDNTLVFVQVRQEHTGVYRCLATNSEGSSEREFRMTVSTLPTILADIPTRMEVGEGDSLTLTCPTSASPPPVIHWIKDGRPLAGMLVERGDEPTMRLSPDRRQLILAESHPADSGNYSCVAINAAGRTDARFAVSVLMTPHFEEFNHLARRSVLVGGSVSLNCSVSGNPSPQVSWRKDGIPVVPGRPPGVVVSRDLHYLMVPNARIQHSGTYTCIATNKITSKEREFYVTVLEPPSIPGEGEEDVELMLGERLVLECPAAGEPRPQITWYAEDCDNTRRALNATSAQLVVENVSANHSTVYFCEAVSTAGTATKLFNVTVLAVPEIEGSGAQDDIEVAVGGNVSLRCMVRGIPRPEVTWLHNGVELDVENKEGSRRRRRSADHSLVPVTQQNSKILATLTLDSVDRKAEGLYTVVASNRAGFTEKRFRVVVAEPPRGVGKIRTEVVVVKGKTAELVCPVEASPPPRVSWFFGSSLVTVVGRHRVANRELKLTIEGTTLADAGNYSCLAINSAGNVTVNVTLKVLEPPWFPDGSEAVELSMVAGTMNLSCTAVGTPPLTISWFKGPQLLSRSSAAFMNLSDLDVEDSGPYSCMASNVAGAAEKTFILRVFEPPFLRDSMISNENFQNVSLHRRLKLDCPISGHPRPNIAWYKDEQLADAVQGVQIMADGSELVVVAVGAEHAGLYKCVAQNVVGLEQIKFYVSVHVTAFWTEWSEWFACSVSCGTGIESRHRTCSFGPGPLDPKLVVDKSQCHGSDRELRDCFTPCPIDGVWSPWSLWGECSASCGNSTRRRHRQCTSPPPSDGGKPCDGASIEEEECSLDVCPALWSEWSDWTECSRVCGGGERRRWRNCLILDADRSTCEGNDFEVELCNTHPCSGGGKWLPWGHWSSCSATCGEGVKRRVRQCKPIHMRHKPCKDKVQMEVCHAQPCSAHLLISGQMNGKPIEAELTADLTGHRMEARSALVAEAAWYPYAPLLLAPVAWNAAAEEDSAVNGFSLTGGRFFTQSKVSFVTGEGMLVRSQGRGVDRDGRMTVEIEVTGEAPIVESSASVQIKSLHQDFVQVGNDALLGMTEDMLLMDGREVPFLMNSSVRYDAVLGTMPYLVEKLSLTDIESKIAPDDQQLAITAAASVSKKFTTNICPPGFLHDQQHMHCADLDECLEDPCHSGKECANTWGSYSCGCRKGYAPRGPRGCEDVNECDTHPPLCHHSCVNTDGSFHCLCSMGYVLATDGSTCLGGEDEESQEPRTQESIDYSSGTNWLARRSAPGVSWPGSLVSCPPGYTTHQPLSLSSTCQDVDECVETPDICGENGLCFNTPGSFQCLDIPCPQGFSREMPSTCEAECAISPCRHGARIAETVVFALLSIHSADFRPFEDVLHLTVQNNNTVQRQQARLLEGHALRLRTVDDHASLYAPGSLKPRTLYSSRVSSYRESENGSPINLTVLGSPAPCCSLRESRTRRISQPPNSPTRPPVLPIDRIMQARADFNARLEEGLNSDGEGSATSFHPDLALDLSSITDSFSVHSSTASSYDESEWSEPRASIHSYPNTSSNSLYPIPRSNVTGSKKVSRSKPVLPTYITGELSIAICQTPKSIKTSESDSSQGEKGSHYGLSLRSRGGELIEEYVETVNNAQLARFFRPCMSCGQACCECPPVPSSERLCTACESQFCECLPSICAKCGDRLCACAPLPLYISQRNRRCSSNDDTCPEEILTGRCSAFSQFLLERRFSASASTQHNIDQAADSGNSTLQMDDSRREALPPGKVGSGILSRQHVSLSVMQLATAAQCARILADSLESVLQLAREELMDGDAGGSAAQQVAERHLDSGTIHGGLALHQNALLTAFGALNVGDVASSSEVKAPPNPPLNDQLLGVFPDNLKQEN